MGDSPTESLEQFLKQLLEELLKDTMEEFLNISEISRRISKVIPKGISTQIQQ